MIYDCMVRIYLDTKIRYSGLEGFLGWHGLWIVPATHTGKNIRVSCEVKCINQGSPGQSPNLGGDMYFYINDVMTNLGVYYQSKNWGLLCGNLGPFQEGDTIKIKTSSRDSPTILVYTQNFQVCELVGQCPGIAIEGLDITLCEFFGYLGQILYSVWQYFEDVGDWFEPMWGIGDEIKGFFYAIGGYFASASNNMWRLRDWCRILTDHINDLFDMNVLITYFTDTFAMLSYTTSQFVTWLYDSLQESINFEGLWDWINHADEWFDTKVSGFKDGLEDWIVEKFEALLDKVFEP